jgi:hypothetical protein
MFIFSSTKETLHNKYYVHHFFELFKTIWLLYSFVIISLHILYFQMRFTHICLICVAVLATGEEHNHTESEPEKFGDPADQNHVHHHDKHADHGHSEHDHDHSPDLHIGHDNHLGPSHRLPDTKHNPVHDYQTWLAAAGSILLISLCGIFGILVIPIMQRVFYQHLIQFLIALAVGTLAGDALLHLLPHAFMVKMTEGNNELS